MFWWYFLCQVDLSSENLALNRTKKLNNTDNHTKITHRDKKNSCTGQDKIYLVFKGHLLENPFN
jgi:hypothetical protein